MYIRNWEQHIKKQVKKREQKKVRSNKIQRSEPGKSLYRGKVHYRLCSCQSTLSLAVGKEENKSFFFKTTF